MAAVADHVAIAMDRKRVYDSEVEAREQAQNVATTLQEQLIQLFGEDRLLAALSVPDRVDAQALAERLREAAMRFAGRLKDDLQILALQLDRGQDLYATGPGVVAGQQLEV